jgi:hypothetical protein
VCVDGDVHVKDSRVNGIDMKNVLTKNGPEVSPCRILKVLRISVAEWRSKDLSKYGILGSFINGLGVPPHFPQLLVMKDMDQMITGTVLLKLSLI